MTPAEELRAAAEKLRALAAEASEAPWTVNRWGNVESADFSEAAEVWPIQAKPGNDAAYIAAMHPGVGTTLADWLHTAAANASALTWPNQFIESALAVARAINGSQS